MISQNEIKEKAREYEVPVSTIERDYAQNWLLKSLSSLPLVLKGGTGIRKVYIGDYRFSDDLDFTLLEDIERDELKNIIKNAIAMAREESGINFSNDIETQENENGFEVSVYFQIMQKGESKTKIKIDITKKANEKILLPLSVRRIIHPYSDTLKGEIKVYTLEEILAEKIRSLFQRTRPRDLYDVWYLWNRVEKNVVFEILPEKFRAKNVEMNIKDFEQRKDDFKNAWESSLRHQLKTLPDFEDAFSTVLGEVERICIEMNREAILTGEIGALLHDIGKLHPDFVKRQSLENIEGLHHARDIDKFIDKALIDYFKNLKIDIDGEEKTVYDLIRYHHDAEDFILECLAKCDHKDSADDKGIVRKKQHLADTWISSPFGYKKEKIDLVCLQKRFEDLENNLIGLFKDYISGTMSLSCFRESLMNTLKTSFSHALGETRIPSNDVSLWDHSYSTASLFKTLLAAKVCGAKIDPKKPQWRIFGICWDGIEFINKGRKIAEIQKRTEIIENIKTELKKKFEDEIPIGNAIYEDTNGIYFTFPEVDIFKIKSPIELKEGAVPSAIIDEFKNNGYCLSSEDLIKKDESNDKTWLIFNRNNNKNYTIIKIQDDENHKSEYIVHANNASYKSKELAKECAKIAIEVVYGKSKNEVWPFFTLSKASSTLTAIAEELKFASEKRKMPKMSPTLFIKKEKGEEQENIESNFDLEAEFDRLANEIKERRKGAKIDICPICRIRPKDEKAERCEICEDRRRGRLEQWLSNKQDTVWIDEVADKNNRVALISLNFYLDRWLDGTMIGTIYSQSFEDWKNGERYKKKTTQNILKDRSIKQTGNSEEDALNIAKWIAENQKRTEVRTLLECFMEDGNADNVPDDIKDDANNILSWFFTQNPSPARLYRIWKETEEFFDLIVRKIRDEIYSNKWRRVKFTVSNGDLKQKLKDTTTYILKMDKLDPQNLLVFHNKDSEFYTIESLEKFKFNNKIGEEAVKEALKSVFKYLAPEDEPDKNLLNGENTIKPVENSIKTEEYYPVIEINRSPLSLRLIVPASDSMKIIELIIKFYNERFKKVLGKLPLNVKLLVAKRKFPLYILLDAEKRMLEGDEFKTQKPMNPWWNVNGLRYEWYYSFYPTKAIEKGKKYTLDNLSSISKGKIFYLYPGYFDFELLLGTTDRYSIYYKGGKRGCEDYKLFTGRPYYFYQISEMLELWDILSENISSSQLNFIEEMLTSKSREWRDIEDEDKKAVLREFAEAVLKDAFGNKWNGLRDETKIFLINSAINGILLDTIILFRHIIKNTEVNENE